MLLKIGYQESSVLLRHLNLAINSENEYSSLFFKLLLLFDFNFRIFILLSMLKKGLKLGELLDFC